jgi:hypothetical protein
MDTTSLVASLVPARPDMITRSSIRPNSGAITPITTIRASGVGQPHWKRICQ